MLISEKPMASMSRTLRTAVVLCAAAVLPLGLSVAQDAGNFDKVETWLEAGVNSAYLTAEQAEVMMRALRSDHARSGAQEAELTMEVITQELEAQFERGQLTEQQVRDRLERKRQELLLQQTRAQREISESPNDR